MPHVIVKLWPGRSEQQKQRLADRIAQDVMGDGSGSVGTIAVACSMLTIGMITVTRGKGSST